MSVENNDNTSVISLICDCKVTEVLFALSAYNFMYTSIWQEANQCLIHNPKKLTCAKKLTIID